MDNQNQKIKAIETKLSDALVEKFDRLIESNERVSRIIERTQLRTGVKVRSVSTLEASPLKEMEKSTLKEEQSAI